MVAISEVLGTCERLFQGRYLAMRQPGVEPATCWLQVQHPNHYTTEPHLCVNLDHSDARVQFGHMPFLTSPTTWQKFRDLTTDLRQLLNEWLVSQIWVSAMARFGP